MNIDGQTEKMLSDPAVVGLVDDLRLRAPNIGRGFFEQALTYAFREGFYKGRVDALKEVRGIADECFQEVDGG